MQSLYDCDYFFNHMVTPVKGFMENKVDWLIDLFVDQKYYLHTDTVLHDQTAQ